jgi:hypothetical protein
MTPHEFAPLWAVMLRAWPAAKPIDGTSSEYARRLAAFTRAEVAAVVDALILECEWMPSIATVWQRCIEARDDAPAWEDAWNEAQAHAEGTREPWSHEVAERVAKTIGLYEIRTSTNPATVRAQFRDAYLSMLQRRRHEFASSARELPPPARPALEARR